MKRWLSGSLLALLMLLGMVSRALSDVAVYVAYVENERPALFFPDPWLGDPNVLFLGYKGTDHDAGAILLRNTGTTDVVLGPGAFVDGFSNGASYKLWDGLIGTGVTIKPGQNLILTETASRNFDSSDQPQITDPSQRTKAVPKIHLTINGANRVYADTGQVLNTGGLDVGDAFLRNESLQWRPVGTTGIEDPAGTGLYIMNVLTQHNDTARTGQMLHETALAPANVGPGSFGKLFTLPVDGEVYAQPLVWPHVGLGVKGLHDILYVATMHNTVYAFDANSNQGANVKPFWQINLGPSYLSSINGCEDNNYETGIVGTPVLDSTTATLYVVAKSYENGQAINRLHALNAYTGAEKFGGPVVFSGSVPGKGDGGDGTTVPFLPSQQMARPALLLLKGVLYIAFGSHCDFNPYHGWVFAYDAKTLKQTAIFNTTPDGGLGGIWMSGGGLAADASNFYCVVGNGSFSKPTGGNDYGEGVLKFGTDAAMTLKDWFVPFNYDILNAYDLDLGSSGLLVLPDGTGSKKHPHLLVTSNKDGRIYLLDRDNLGQYHAGDDSQVVQSLPGAMGGAWSAPAYYKGQVYFQGVGDVLKAYSLANGQLSTTPISQSAQSIAYPGATPSVSASLNAKGLVWTIENAGVAVLHAYDASDVSKELFNSQWNAPRDGMGTYTKFAMPTICNAKVYVGTAGAVNVYGSGFWADAPAISPPGGVFTGPVTVTITPSATPGGVTRYTTDGSDPTPTSPVYTAPFTASVCEMVKARTFAYGFKPSYAAQAPITIDPTPATGDGLWATYFNSTDLTGTPVTHIDPTINIGGSAPPIAGIGATNFSARWTGQVQAHCEGLYTFYTYSDDGIRVWVNGQQIIDNWTGHGTTEDRGTIYLKAGQKADLKVEFFQGGGPYNLQLAWSSALLPWQLIPQNQLYSGHVAPPVIAPAGGTFSGATQVTIADATPTATITYTLNGQEPTATSTPYKTPFSLRFNTTVKAKAFLTGAIASGTTTATFTRNDNKPVYQINCGGGAAAPYITDNFVTGGGTYIAPGTVDISLVSMPAPQAVYLAERWGEFTYTLPNLVKFIKYTVRLHFAEVYYNAPGQRIMNVLINGQTALANFDVVAAAGGSFRAICPEFTVQPDNAGKITIQFQSVQDNPKCSGIEIIPIGDQGD